MAAIDPPPLRRRFVTRIDVEDAHRAGQGVVLEANDVITDEAAQRARDLGVTVQRPDRARAARPAAPASASAPASAGAEGDLRVAIRAAVIAELGAEPPDLDAVITRVLGRRSRS